MKKRNGRRSSAKKIKTYKRGPKVPGRIVTGVFRANPRGFGFVEQEDGKRNSDIFIPASEVNGAWDQDLVEVRLSEFSREGRERGEIVRILGRGKTEYVGLFQKDGQDGIVIPDDPKMRYAFFVSKELTKNAKSGEKVIVKIHDSESGRDRDPYAEIIEVLGDADAPGMDLFSIVRELGIPYEFPPIVQKAAKQVPMRIPEEEYLRRRDLRSLLTMTIDGPDAKDLDDAVTMEMDGECYRLGVHIADVSHYVREGSPLDREALKRGTSVYLADRVIPMLPEELSNGICSLNAGEDRLALSCEMVIDSSGHVVRHEIFESVIRVDERMSYPDVKEILEGTSPELSERYHDLVPTLFEMRRCADLLNLQRTIRGSIQFEFPETKIRLDNDGVPIEILPQTADCATTLIEEFMLAANETIAEEFCRKKYPFVYRIHEDPDPDKIEELISFASLRGAVIRKHGQYITPKELQNAIDAMKGMPCEMLMNRTILRSMQQAKYSERCTGHFGLAAKYYCHFTSPIRRYPDLQIHRIIREVLSGAFDEERMQHYREILSEVAERSSLTERRSVDAERETEKLKKAEYMSRHIGEQFDGIISSLTSRGMYVELENTVEGLVDVAGMCDDYYDFDEKEQVLKGRLAGRRYEIGEPVRVRVTAVDLNLRTIDFELC